MGLVVSCIVLAVGVYWSGVFSTNMNPEVSTTSVVLKAQAESTSFVALMTDTTITTPSCSQTSVSTSARQPVSGDDIFLAAADGRWKDVQKFLQSGNEPSDQDASLFTPLHHAAASGDEKTIDMLLGMGKTGWYALNHVTPLHIAAKHGHTMAVRQILTKYQRLEFEKALAPQSISKIQAAMEHKFDNTLHNFFAKKTFTARELAAVHGHQATVLAFSRGSNDGIRDAISCACMMGDVKMVRALWKDHNARWSWARSKGLYSQVPGFPAAPLHLAVMSGSLSTVAFLLEEGLSPTYRQWWSNNNFPSYSPAIHYAATVGSIELVKTLERFKADATSLDYLSRTPLSYAVEGLNVELAEYLLQKKYPDRGMMIFGSRKQNNLLGSGHVWRPKPTNTAAISRQNKIHRMLRKAGIDAP